MFSRQYQEEVDLGFPGSLVCALLLLLLLGGIQAVALPRTTILLLLFLTAFIWIAVILMLLLAVRYYQLTYWYRIQFVNNRYILYQAVPRRLRCIEWDISRSFLLRLGLTIFSVVLIFTMAQVNAFTCHVDTTCAIDRACSGGGTAKEDVEVAEVTDGGGSSGGGVQQAASCHRWCPLPHYAVLSCLIGFMTVAIFLRVWRLDMYVFSVSKKYESTDWL